MTQKTNELFVRVIVSNPDSSRKREWFWTPDYFFEQVGQMRILHQVSSSDAAFKLPMHTLDDPFWSPPEMQRIGDAYLYLAPVAYGVGLDQWIAIHNYRGDAVGDVHVQLSPKTKPTNDPDTLLGQAVAFELTIVEARGLFNWKKVVVMFYFGLEEFPHATPPATSTTGDPQWSQKYTLGWPDMLTQFEIDYLCKDAICLSVIAETDDVVEPGARSRTDASLLGEGVSLAREAKQVMQEHAAELEQLKQRLVEECIKQHKLLSESAVSLGLQLDDTLALWQLPGVLLTNSSNDDLPDDPEELKRLVRDLRAQLKDCKEKLSQAGSKPLSHGGPKEAKQPGFDAVVPGPSSPPREPKSSACTIL